MMQEKGSMLKGMPMPKKKKPAGAPLPGMEEEGMEEEAPESEVEINLGDLGGEDEGEAEETEENSSMLTDISDDELLAEVEKRGLSTASGGASTMSLPEPGEDEAPRPKKKTPPAPKMF